MNLKKLFRRRSFARVESGGVRILGNKYDIALMMDACVTMFEEMGYDMEEVKKAIQNIEDIGE